ncbi:MAG: class I SAM-dependent methyltransferase [Hydrogenothermaceae bacterium]|nr:class I SAM-dependent methyltransferase [Hydrogenothermaceae bacterium]
MEKSVAESIFDSVHRAYDRFLNFATLKKINSWQLEVINSTPLGKYVVDVGTGTGEILLKLSAIKKDLNLLGLDISLNMLKVAKRKLENQGVKNFLLLKADALNMPIKDSSVDNIFFSLVFRHLPADKILYESKRVLVKDGYISIVEIAKPNSRFLYSLMILLTDKIFRPFGRVLFSKVEWDYFVDSIKNSMTRKELIEFFMKNGFKSHYYSKRFFGLIHIAVFKREE